MIKYSSHARVAAVAGAIAIFTLPLAPVAAKVQAGTQIFNGIVQHVSPNNIKVHDPVSGQTLSFLLVPHFNKIFKGDGQTTAQQAALRNGTYVKVYYDQKALGARHADRILILNNHNAMMGKQKG